MKKIILICILSSSLFACKFNQDPFSDKIAAIKEAEPPAPREESPKPIDSNLLIIDLDDLYRIDEGDSLEFEIKTRVLEKNFNTPNLAIDNLDEFENASFDPKTNKFKWSPPKGLIPESQLSVNKILVVRAYSQEKTSKVIISKTRRVEISVVRKLSVPVIKSMIFSTDYIVENENTVSLFVVVNDPDSTSGKGLGPELILGVIKSTDSLVNIGQYLSFVDRKFNANTGDWVFEYNLMLSEESVVSDTKMGGILLIPISRFGTRGAAQTAQINVYNKFSTLMANLSQSIRVPVGKESVLDFEVFDPKTEGHPEFVKIDRPEIKLNCVSTNQAFKILCRLKWTPTQQESGRFVVTFQNTNAQSQGRSLTETDFYIDFKVE